jgi:hypothetical protein
MEKQKKEFLEVAFAECNDHCTRRRDFIKNKINFFVECQDHGARQRNFSLGKEFFFKK